MNRISPSATQHVLFVVLNHYGNMAKVRLEHGKLQGVNDNMPILFIYSVYYSYDALTRPPLFFQDLPRGCF